MLSASHETLVDDLRGIVATRVNMHTLLHHTVRAGSECLASLVPARLDLRLRRGHGVLGRKQVVEVKSGVVFTIQLPKIWSRSKALDMRANVERRIRWSVGCARVELLDLERG